MDKSLIPEGYNAVMPALCFNGAAAAMEWYKKIFGATEKMKMTDNEGKVVHGEIVIGGSVLMVSEEFPQYNKSPKTLGGNSINLCIYVPDVDAVMQNAVEDGAKLLMHAEDQFYGDRSGRIEDPFGYVWIISTHIKDVSEEEMQKIMQDMNQKAES
jgi:PhnB protein